MGKTFPLPKPLKQGGTGCEAIVVKVKKEEEEEDDSSGRSSSPGSEVGGGGLGGNKAERIVVGRMVGDGEGRVVVIEKRDGKRSNRGGGRKAVAKREEEGTGTGTMGCGCDSGGVGGRRGKEKDPGRVVVVGRGSSVGEGWLRPFNPEFFGDLDGAGKYYLDYCTSLALTRGSPPPYGTSN